MKLFIFVFILSGTCAILAQDIILPEEEITGYDEKIFKSEVPPIPATEMKVEFGQLPMPEREEPGEFAETEIDVADAKIEDVDEGVEIYPSRESRANFFAGRYGTFRGEFFHEVHEGNLNYILGAEKFRTSGHRKNGRADMFSFNFSASETDKKTGIEFSAGSGEVSLPGKYGSFSNEKRDQFYLRSGLSFHPEDNLSAGLKYSYYSIDDIDQYVIDADIALHRGSFIHKSGVERHTLGKHFTDSIFYGIFWEEGNLKAGLGVKKISSHGIKILPYLSMPLADNLSFGVDSYYNIPALCEEVLIANYKKLVDNALSPEERYRLGFKYEKENPVGSFKIELMRSFVRNYYIWSDIDNSGLLQPLPEDLEETSLNLEMSRLIRENLKVFFRGEKKFFSEKIDYVTGEKYDAGFSLGLGIWDFSTWLEYRGPRRFDGSRLSGFSTLNHELTFHLRDGIDWGVGVYNVTNEEYESAPGYPAEARNVYSFLRILF